MSEGNANSLVQSGVKRGAIIAVAFKQVCRMERFRNKWMTDASWCRAIKECIDLGSDFDVMTRDLNIGVSDDSSLKFYMDNFDVPNECGAFRQSHRCGKKKTTWYYAVEPGNLLPKQNKSWWKDIYDYPLSTTPRKRPQSNLTKTCKQKQHDGGVTVKEPLDLTMVPRPEVKRQKVEPKPPAPLDIFWSAAEVINFINCKGEDLPAQEAIKKRLKVLEAVINEDNGWESVVEETDMPLSFCKPNHIRVLRLKSQYLYKALTIALAKMPEWKNFRRCCQEACESLATTGVTLIGSVRTVEEWHSTFRQKGNRFAVPRKRSKVEKS